MGQGADQQGLKADRPVALYGAPREVAEVARLLRQQGIKQLFELQGLEGGPGSTWPLAAAGLSALAGGSAGRQAGRRRPKGDWKVFEVDWGAPKGLPAEPHPGGRLHRHQPPGGGTALEQGL